MKVTKEIKQCIRAQASSRIRELSNQAQHESSKALALNRKKTAATTAQVLSEINAIVDDATNKVNEAIKKSGLVWVGDTRDDNDPIICTVQAHGLFLPEYLKVLNDNFIEKMPYSKAYMAVEDKITTAVAGELSLMDVKPEDLNDKIVELVNGVVSKADLVKCSE